jgi:hypothetical protein
VSIVEHCGGFLQIYQETEIGLMEAILDELAFILSKGLKTVAMAHWEKRENASFL